MPTYRTKGIVIKKTDYAEADRLLTIFTSSLGKVRAIAKGVRRTSSKMGGHLEIFNVVDLMLAQGRNLETVTSVNTIHNFSNICGSLNKTCRAYYILEILDKLTPDEHKDTRIFNLCVKTFQILDSSKIEDNMQEDLVVQASEFKLLKLLGFSPMINHCLQCQTKVEENKTYYFSNAFSGIICDNCRSFDKTAARLTLNQLKLMRIMDREDFDLILRLDIEEKELTYVNGIINSYIRFVIEKDIKSLSFMRKVDNLK